MSYQIDNYNIIMDSVHIIITDSDKKYQSELKLLNVNNLLCDDNSDIYNFLDEQFTTNNVSFKIIGDKLVGTIKISKFKDLKFQIPEVVEDIKKPELLFFELNQTFMKPTITKLIMGYCPYNVTTSKYKIVNLFKIICLNVDYYSKDSLIYKNNRIINNCRYIKLYNENDLLNLQYLTDLKYLAISNNKKYSISSYENLNRISKCKNLTLLLLNKLTKLTDISFCSQLPNLRELYLLDCPNIEDISCLKDCINLQYLDVTGSINIKNINRINNSNLQIINLSLPN